MAQLQFTIWLSACDEWSKLKMSPRTVTVSRGLSSGIASFSLVNWPMAKRRLLEEIGTGE